MSTPQQSVFCKLVLWSGRPLLEVQGATRKPHDFVKLHKQQNSLQLHKLLLQFVNNRTVRTSDPLILSGAAVASQDEAYQVARESNNQYMLIDIPMLRLWLAVYFNHYDLAWENGSRGQDRNPAEQHCLVCYMPASILRGCRCNGSISLYQPEALP
jgi:hypothetical protein